MPVKLIILKLWRRLSGSFWFLPSLMVSSTVGLACTNLYLDHLMSDLGAQPTTWWTVASVETARSLLSTIAGSMITVAGVTFSIVIVALTLAASQFGPRLLVGFMQDTGNQFVLGTFVSVFAYCLIVLVQLPESGSQRVPQIATLTSLALAALAVGVLIYFFHHISTSIQAGELVREAGRALDHALERALPKETSEPDEPREQEATWPPEEFSGTTADVPSQKGGYLNRLDDDRLLEIAVDHDLRLLVVPQPGDFLITGQPLATVAPADSLDDDIAQAIREAIPLETKRENCEDLPLALDRLTEIAVRGLSPGINDPYTAINALDQATACLARILDRLPARQVREDDDGTARVYLRTPDGSDVLERALGPIRTYGSRDARVLAALVETLSTLGCAGRERWHAALRQQLESVVEVAGSGLELQADRVRIEGVCQRAMESLVPPASPAGPVQPAWACAMGRDAHGTFADLELDGVRHRLRWIPPGSCQIGSPPSEAGRYAWEGPQREATVDGFWLGEAPCTQDLWQAVTGDNPSKFVSPRRPVEQVSWLDCRDFLEQLRARLPTLNPCLPSEVQWEYACRAGTTTSTFAGELEIVNQYNAPLLDEIAWYAGNSCHAFDLDVGVDATRWEGRQYPGDQAGTRLVAAKRANPWGLYDMLGNVLEWCHDEVGSKRISRGGSWSYSARCLRAAYRGWWPPESRFCDLGFRLALK